MTLNDLENSKTFSLIVLVYSNFPSKSPLTDNEILLKIDSNNIAYVNVPWNDTTYSEGEGIKISSSNRVNLSIPVGMNIPISNIVTGST